MVDKEKIILMTRLAVLDKNYMYKDKKILSNYIGDYVYINNFMSRILIFIATVILMGVQVLWRIEKGLNIPTTRDEWVYDYIVPYIGVLIIVMVVYSIISTLVYRKNYKEATKRGEKYDKIANELQELSKKTEVVKEVVSNTKVNDANSNITTEGGIENEPNVINQTVIN
ncbi:MAG: hypothetical protein BEN19_02245 [Epulopiscium sp. Nuni2H_MBin003]|nr:MAG: hypothetical protein BEN19_02245 [Epulopiscium sp. Nuni2H_MBin003]